MVAKSGASAHPVRFGKCSHLVLQSAVASISVGLLTTVSNAQLAAGVYAERIGGTSGYGAGTDPASMTTQVPLFIDGFSPVSGTPSGTAVPANIVSAPTADSGANHGITNTGTEKASGAIPFAGGYMGTSPSGQFLAINGFSSDSGDQALGVLDTFSNTLDTSLQFAGSVGPRSAAPIDGTHVYTTSSGNAIRYSAPTTPSGAVTASYVQVSVANLNQRVAAIYGGQLFIDGASSVGKSGGVPQPGIAALASGLPTSGTTNTQTYIITSGPNPQQFVMLDQNPSVGYVNNLVPAAPVNTGLDLTYVATDNGIEKYTFDGTNWTLAATFNSGLSGLGSQVTTKMLGVTYGGKDDSGNNVIYATTAGNNSDTGNTEGNALMKLVDNGGSPSWQLVSLSPANTWLRGIGVVHKSGDVNGDFHVNSSDFDALAAHFGQTAQSAGYAVGDFNYDGIVNTLDFNALATNFGYDAYASSPGAVADSAALGSVVPEPASISVLLLAGLFARRSRRTSIN